MARKLEVEFVGDTRNLDRSFNKAGRGADKFGKQVTLMGRLTSKGGAGFGLFTRGATAATAALVGGAGLIVAVKKVSEAFGEAEASQARLKAQLKAGGISYKAHAKQIDQVIQRISKLAALDDEDLQDAFTNIVRTTGSVSKSLKLTGLAADFARGKHIDVAKAGEIVAKVAGGNTGILSRYGITIEKGASATEALAALQKKFAGQAEEYGKTSAAASDRFSVAVENLQEWLGGQLAPTFKTVKNAVAEFVQGITTGTGAGGRFRDRMTEAFEKVKSVVLSLVPTVVSAFATVKSTLAGIVDTIRTLVTNFREGKAGAVAIVAGLAAIGGAAVAIYAVSTAMRVAAVATTVWAAAQALLNAALTANPIGLVIVGLAALAAGLTVAYTKSETFRNIVNGAFTAVKAAATTVFPIVKKMAELGLLGPIGLAITHWTSFKGFLGGVWSAIKTGAGIWVSIGKAITLPIQATVSAVKALIQGKGLTGVLVAAWDTIKTGASSFAGDLKGVIVSAFEGAANAVIAFMNKIIDAVNVVLGFIGAKKIGRISALGGGKDKPKGNSNIPVDKLARGGAFGLTGGLVSSPMVMMGEEAPRHPEFVIPTNPAYRDRARGLLGQAAGALGFAQGGVFGKSQLASLWTQAGGPADVANLMAAIALAESGGNPRAHNPSGASGLWQILGLPFAGNVWDPLTNARMAVSKYRSQGLGAWEAYTNGAYKNFDGGGGSGGLLGTIGGLVTGGLDAVLGKLPGLGELPDWLHGLGGFVKDKAGSWIKEQLGGLGNALAGGKLPELGSKGLRAAMSLAQRMGLGITSTTGGHHTENSWHYKGRAFDAAGPAARMLAYAQQMLGLAPQLLELFYDPLGRYVKNGQIVAGAIGGHSDHVHTAMAKGGIFGPYVGAYKNGGTIPQTGMAFVHKGETVIPSSMQQMFTGGQILKSDGMGFGGRKQYTLTDMVRPWASWAGDHWEIADLSRGGTWHAYKSGRVALVPFPKSPAVSGGGSPAVGPAAEASGSDPQIDTLSAEIAGLNDTITGLRDDIELQRQATQDALRRANVSERNYETISAAIADIANRRIGGALGLGFMTPDFAGNGVRY